MNACESKTEHYPLTASLSDSCLFAKCFKFRHSEQQETLFLQIRSNMQTYTQDISNLALVTIIKIFIKNTPHDYLCVEGVPCSDNSQRIDTLNISVVFFSAQLYSQCSNQHIFQIQ